MNRCSNLPLAVGLCLLAALTLCPTTEAATTTCFPDAAPDNTGSVYGGTPYSSLIEAWRNPMDRLIGYDHGVGYARFNISAIPDDVMILGVTLHYYVNASSGHADYKITPLELDPLVTSDWWIRGDIWADAGPRHPYHDISNDTGPGWQMVDLGRSGVVLLRSVMDAGWFGVGFFNRTSGIRVDGWAEPNPPYLEVEHRPGPLTYHVDDDGPFDPGPGDPTVSDPSEDGSAAHPFDSIQEAVDAAYWDGGSVVETALVADGLYTGEGNRDIDLDGNVLHIRSANGPEHCIIDCQGSAAEPHRGFYLKTEGTYTVLEGFTITGGYEQYGGAIFCTTIFSRPYSRPVIRGNVITGNVAGSSSYAHGGGIYGGYSLSSALITNNVISNNEVVAPSIARGGGVYCGTGTVSGNLVTGNQALGTSAEGGGIFAGGNVSNNIVTGNHSDDEGGGIYCDYYISPTRNGAVFNNAVSENTAANGAGIAFAATLHNCTVTGNVASEYAGGLRAGYDSVITDCIIEGNEAALGNEIYFGGYTHDVSYSNIGRGANDIHEGYGALVNWGPGMIEAESGFAMGAGGDLYLGQVAAGQNKDSICLDAGSDFADQIQIPLAFTMTDGTTSWAPVSDRTTATNFTTDSGMVDMGFHYPVLDTVTSRLDMVPTAGFLPFATRITTMLANNYTGQSRRVAGRLDVTLAGGASYTNWRAGWTNISGGTSYTSSWIQSIPALPSLIGANLFALHVEDVTPTPYNQPPYPASGDSDSDTVTLTGVAP